MYSTWKMYSGWWTVFVEWCQRAEVEMVEVNGELVRREMEASVAVLGKELEYAASTMGAGCTRQQCHSGSGGWGGEN